MLHQAVILAGGLGTRLGEATKHTPKPLLDAGGRPFLEYLVWNLKRHGITDILFSVGHKARKIMDHFGDGSAFGVRARYVVEQTPMGTGGGLKLAREHLQERFLVLNGDTLFDINYLDLAMRLDRGDALAALSLRSIDDASRYGSVVLEHGRVTGFREKVGSGPGLISGGIYAMRRQAVDRLPQGPCSIEEDLFAVLATESRLLGWAYDGFFLDIGLPETLAEAQTVLPRWRRKPAVFLDRDGVLNVNHGYVHRVDQWDWIPGAVEAVKRCNDAGRLVMIVTNQSGIGRGYYDLEQFQTLMGWVNRELAARGGHLDAVYHCPHHPTEARGEYLTACDCRKPAPGMIRQALAEWDVDVARSVMVGDSPKDMQAAQAVGIRGELFKGGDLLEFFEDKGLLPAPARA